MADTPKRPVMLRFILGQSPVKRRRESEDTTRFLVEQVAVQFAKKSWDDVKGRLQEMIASDVRAELVHLAGQFRRNVIGAPPSQRGLVGTLTTVTKGSFMPKESLGALPRWAPRGAQYLARKRKEAGQNDWFDTTGWVQGGARRPYPDAPGTLADFFSSDIVDTEGGGEIHVGSGGVFEDMFGGISVQVLRNNRSWGVNQGTIRMTPDGRKAQVQLGTVRVRALGKLTDSMIHHTGDDPNKALLDLIVGSGNRAVALHLRGGRGRYRPALEPYLRFFLERAIPQAVTERIRKGAAGSLFRSS